MLTDGYRPGYITLLDLFASSYITKAVLHAHPCSSTSQTEHIHLPINYLSSFDRVTSTCSLPPTSTLGRCLLILLSSLGPVVVALPSLQGLRLLAHPKDETVQRVDVRPCARDENVVVRGHARKDPLVDQSGLVE